MILEYVPWIFMTAGVILLIKKFVLYEPTGIVGLVFFTGGRIALYYL
jgi:hypothetical protein